MGLSFSKSVRFGAVRFNFSGAGIGVSVGIPGLRIGTGPRGAYISGGAGGFRYRRSLNAPAVHHPAPANLAPTAYPGSASTYVPNVAATVTHDNKNVLELTDSSSDSLLQSMNEQRKKSPVWPVASIVAVLTYFMLANLLLAWHPIWRVLLGSVLATGLAWVYWRDSMRKLTVLFFEPDAATDQRFETLRTAVMTAASANKLKSISSTSRYSDMKYSAGASQGLQFSNAFLKLGQAPGVAANIEVPLLKTGRTTLAFYPDRILAFQGRTVGAAAYSSLQASAEHTRYVEAESVPRDARVVDKTWQYVNKSGGPDRRFKYNRELPVCAYSKLILSTSSGLDIRLLGSKEGGMEPLASALGQMKELHREAR